MRQFLLRKIILLILIALVSGCSTPEYKKDSLYSGLLDPGTVSVSAEKFKSGRRLALVLSNNSWKTMAKIHEVQLERASKAKLNQDGFLKSFDISFLINNISGMISQEFASVNHFNDLKSIPKDKFDYIGILDVVLFNPNFEDGWTVRCDVSLALLDNQLKKITEIGAIVKSGVWKIKRLPAEELHFL